MAKKSLEEIISKIKEIEIAERFDIMVAIAEGGLVPAFLLNQKLNLPLEILWLNLRDENQTKLYEQPKLLKPINFDFQGKNILLVEDRVKTGTTIKYAKELLADASSIKVFAVNGQADYCLYDEECFMFPWKLK